MEEKKHLSWQCVVETDKNLTKTSSYLPWRKYKPNRTLFFTIFKYIGTRKLKSHPIQVKVTKIVLSPQVTLTIYILWTILSIKLCSFLTKSVGRSLSDLFSLVPQIGTQSVLSRFVLSYLQFPLETSTQNTFPWHVRRCVWPNVSYLTVHRSIDPQGNPSPCCLNAGMRATLCSILNLIPYYFFRCRVLLLVTNSEFGNTISTQKYVRLGR